CRVLPPREGDEVVSKGPITPMLGLDGKPVIGPDGEMVYMQDGRPIPKAKKEEDGEDEVPKPKEPTKKRKPFQKKTRQIFTIPEEQRQLQREERYPWVLEDNSGQETWIGRIENADKASFHGLFLTGTGSDFYFVPAHRWYKMQKRPNFKTATMEEVEAQYARLQKNHTLEFWKKRQQQSQEAVAAAEAQGRPINLGHIVHQPSLVRSSGGQSLASGGRRLRTVIKGDSSLFGDGDDDELKDSLRKRREKELGEEGDLDEIEYEEEFADDDEKMNVDEEDEEAKELEERIKRETRAANKLREAGVEEDESDEEEDFLKNLTGAGKAVKKALRTHEKNALYDSDDEKNPYLTSDEEEEEPPTNQPTGVEPTATPTPSGSKAAKSSTPSQQQKSGSTPKAQSKTPSRATSPSVPRAKSPAAPPGSGSSLLAQRATSPKGKNVPGSSCPTSPKPQHPGATGAGAARATSPLAGGSGSRATSPTAPSGLVKKRKVEELSSPTVPSSAVKKAKKTVAPGATPAPPPDRKIDEAFVVEWLRAQPERPTTMQCIGQFRPYLVDKKSKDVLTNIIRKVAELKGGVLTLRAGFL
ncbi:hypothetical protein AURDEDRAFT_111714, partial [Auricularia subglabra TFB-10046 SS5]